MKKYHLKKYVRPVAIGKKYVLLCIVYSTKYLLEKINHTLKLIILKRNSSASTIASLVA